MRQFGLIGYPLGHSFSQQYFTAKFQREGIPECSYRNFEMSSLDSLPAVLADPSLAGFNITIPFKQDILRLLDEPEAVVQQIGACNCVRIVKGKLFGYNTDAVGFESSLKQQLLPSHDRALILGTGGSSKAVAYVLEKLGIDFLFVTTRATRQPDHLSYEALTGEIIRNHRLIVNCTPLGMSPKVDASPNIPYSFIGPHHYLFDLIYNPAQTQFLREGAARGTVTKNGEEMLVIQADESWRIWNRPVAG